MPRIAGQSKVPSAPVRAFLVALVAFVFVGCPCIKGPVNASPGLRWWLFSNFGAQKMCPEMLKKGAPLKLSPEGNTIGRFFPTRCRHDINDDKRTVTIHFGGTGYAWTPVAGRVGFSMDASVEYGFDFFMAEDAVYVWAKRPNVIYGPDFKVGAIENKVVDFATKTPAGFVANTFGNQIVSYHLFQGFTVVHSDSGDEFTLGLLQPPARPPRPFDTSEDRFVFANETAEIRNNQLDFLGPFEVPDDDQALFLRMRLTGPALDVMVFHRGTADLWRDALQRGGALTAPPGPPVVAFPLNPGVELKRKTKLPAGQYMVVVDNSPVGVIKPPWNPLGMVGGGTAIVSYSAELGDDDEEF